jgi:hypothetical protein
MQERREDFFSLWVMDYFINFSWVSIKLTFCVFLFFLQVSIEGNMGVCVCFVLFSYKSSMTFFTIEKGRKVLLAKVLRNKNKEGVTQWGLCFLWRTRDTNTKTKKTNMIFSFHLKVCWNWDGLFLQGYIFPKLCNCNCTWSVRGACQGMLQFPFYLELHQILLPIFVTTMMISFPKVCREG